MKERNHNSQIKVSVLTPLYRTNSVYVRQCLDSLCGQTLQECEFILIDNGANEENKKLIKEYLKRDPRFKSIHFKQNVGTGAALNRGLETAHGIYVGFLESDDFIARNMYACLWNETDKGKLDVVKSLYYTLDEAGITKLENNFPHQQCGRLLNQTQCTGLIRGHVSHWSGIYRRNFLKENKVTFNETPGAHSQDFGFMISVYAFAKSVYIVPHAYITYRIHTGNHEFKYLNDCMLDECELTLGKLQNEQLEKEFWNVVYKTAAPRLKICFETSNFNQKLRIKKLLRKIEKLQDYKYFRPHERNEIEKFIHNNVLSILKSFLFSKKKTSTSKKVTLFGTPFETLAIDAGKTIHKYFWGIFKTKQKSAEYKCFLFGLPLFAKLDTVQKKYLKILGIPVYYREESIKIQLANIQKQLTELRSSNQASVNANMLINRRISNLKCVLDAQILHPKTFGQYKNIYAGREVVLVCTGPTANQYIPRKGAIHVGVNGAIYLEKIKLDFLFMQDYTIKQANNSSLTSDGLKYVGNNCVKFFGIIPDELNKSNEKINIHRIPAKFSYAERTYRYVLEDWPKHNIASDLSHEPLGQFYGTPFSALQFILYTHPKRLFLVGWDCGSGYAYGRKNAMGPANYQVEILKEHFVPFIEINYPDIEIISLNPVGLKGIFKDIHTN